MQCRAHALVYFSCVCDAPCAARVCGNLCEAVHRRAFVVFASRLQDQRGEGGRGGKIHLFTFLVQKRMRSTSAALTSQLLRAPAVAARVLLGQASCCCCRCCCCCCCCCLLLLSSSLSLWSWWSWWWWLWWCVYVHLRGPPNLPRDPRQAKQGLTRSQPWLWLTPAAALATHYTVSSVAGPTTGSGHQWLVCLLAQAMCLLHFCLLWPSCLIWPRQNLEQLLSRLPLWVKLLLPLSPTHTWMQASFEFLLLPTPQSIRGCMPFEFLLLPLPPIHTWMRASFEFLLLLCPLLQVSTIA